jgi:hypothetical protein
MHAECLAIVKRAAAKGLDAHFDPAVVPEVVGRTKLVFEQVTFAAQNAAVEPAVSMVTGAGGSVVPSAREGRNDPGRAAAAWRKASERFEATGQRLGELRKKFG